MRTFLVFRPSYTVALDKKKTQLESTEWVYVRVHTHTRVQWVTKVTSGHTCHSFRLLIIQKRKG